MKRFLIGMSLAALLVGGMTTQSLALPLTGICAGQKEGLGFCEKSVELDGNVLTIILKNTSPGSNGGFLTADAFNLNVGTTIDSFSHTGAGNFGLVSTTAGSINVAPDGFRQFAISNDPTATQPWLGSGSPLTGGLGVGQTATFKLGLGGDLTGITPESVFTTQVIRFRGFKDGGSDKTQTIPTGPGPGPGSLPVPSSFLLIGVGLVSLGLAHLKKGPKN